MEFLRRLLQSVGMLTSSKVEDKNDYPSAGTFVPVDYHEYLDNNFHLFCKGDHVAYEVYDPRFQETYNTEPSDIGVMQLTDSTDAVYVHTTILGEVEEEIERRKEKPTLLKKYEIDLGGGRIATVSATRLYRFLIEEEEETIALREHVDNYTPLPVDLTLYEEIRFALKEAKWLPKEEDRICVCKRLVLKGQVDHKESFSCFVKALAENILDKEKLDKLFNADIATQMHVGERQVLNDKDEVDAYPKAPQPVGGQGVPWTIIANKRGCQRGLRRTCGMWTVGCNPQRSEGLRWFRQAQADLQTAMSAMGSYPQGFNWICFLCHQAIEKGLKALLYYRDANKCSLNSHSLAELSSRISDQPLIDMAKDMETLVGQHTVMRYPDLLEFPHIPAEVYDAEHADKACCLTKIALRRIANLLQ